MGRDFRVRVSLLLTVGQPPTRLLSPCGILRPFSTTAQKQLDHLKWSPEITTRRPTAVYKNFKPTTPKTNKKKTKFFRRVPPRHTHSWPSPQTTPSCNLIVQSHVLLLQRTILLHQIPLPDQSPSLCPLFPYPLKSLLGTWLLRLFDKTMFINGR